MVFTGNKQEVARVHRQRRNVLNEGFQLDVFPAKLVKVSQSLEVVLRHVASGRHLETCH